MSSKKKPGRQARVAASGAPQAKAKLKRGEYEKQLEKLHVELVKLQQWVVHKGLKVCIIFEGRDGAGKERARLNLITHLLERIPYQDAPREKVKLPKRQKAHGYREPDYPYKYVKEKF